MAGSGLQEDVRTLNGSGKGIVTYKYKSDDTRTREREKRHPIASATGMLGGHVVQRRKKGEQRVSAAFVPHTNGRHSVGIGEKERRTQADEITPSDLCNQARFFYRSYAHIRSIPHKIPEIERPIKGNTRWVGERRSWRWYSRW